MASNKIPGMNPLLTWIEDIVTFYSKDEIKIPADYRTQCIDIKKILRDDVSGLVNSVLDFAIEGAVNDYTIETDNQELNDVLNEWARNINSSLLGKIPTGVEELAKEYFRERWKGSSVLLLRTLWETKDGWTLPTKMWFVKGEDILLKVGDKDVSNYDINAINPDNTLDSISLDDITYELRLNKDSTIPLPENKKNEVIFLQKPYASWASLNPTPFLIQRGIYRNLLMLSLLEKKGEQIVAKALEYLLLLKKGTEGLVKENITYSEDDLKKVKSDFQEFIQDKNSNHGISTYVSNFDTAIEHSIPEYSKILKMELYTPIERRILFGLGLVDIVQGASSTRRESTLNPRPFISMVNQGIKDYKKLLLDIIQEIKNRNPDHKKYIAKNIRISTPPVKAFMTDDFKVMLRSLYDRGLISKQTFTELAGEVTFQIEVDRRKKEEKITKVMYPPIIQNLEQYAEVKNSPDNKEKIPEDKKGIEKKNFTKSSIDEIEPYEGTEQEFVEAIAEAQLVFEQAPYSKNTDLPPAVKKYPSGAQTAFRKAFNNALEHYKDETTAFKVAWVVLKNYMKSYNEK